MWSKILGFGGKAVGAVTGFAYWKWVGIAVLFVVIAVIAATAWARGVEVEAARVRVSALEAENKRLSDAVASDREIVNANTATLSAALDASKRAVDSCLEHVRITEKDKAALRAVNRALQERANERDTVRSTEQNTLYNGECSTWSSTALCDDADRIVRDALVASGSGDLARRDSTGSSRDHRHDTTVGVDACSTGTGASDTVARMRAEVVQRATGDPARRLCARVAASEPHARVYRSMASVAW